MKKYTIEQKMSNIGSIHDIASDIQDRHIRFVGHAQYAVVLASYYGGKGYKTYHTVESLIADKRWRGGHSYEIIDSDGNKYGINGNELVAIVVTSSITIPTRRRG